MCFVLDYVGSFIFGVICAWVVFVFVYCLHSTIDDARHAEKLRRQRIYANNIPWSTNDPRVHPLRSIRLWTKTGEIIPYKGKDKAGMDDIVRLRESWKS